MPTRTRAKQIDYQGYVQIELDESDIDAVMESTSKPALLWLAIVNAASDGYKFSCSKDTDENLFKCTLMDIDTSRTSCGWMLSGQGDALVQALAALVYKHDARMSSDWVPFLVSKTRVNRIR